MSNKIRVGIIGANPDRGWAAAAHIPALQSLPDFEITALSTSRRESALAAAAHFGVPAAFDNHHDLVTRPDVDVVAVTVKVPRHFELVSAALNAGKAVYCEWPLGNGLNEAEQLAALARQQGRLAVAGLQARFAPAIAYVHDLIHDGYVGEVLSTTLVGSGMVWGASVGQADAYTADIRNGATMLSIPFGHTVDALCHCLGEFTELTATLASRRKTILVAETNTVIPMTSHDQIAVSGVLESGAVASIHYRGGVSRGTNLLWEVNGTDGDLQITSFSGHAQIFELALSGGRAEAATIQALPVPDRYRWVSPHAAPGYPFNVAQTWDRFASDYRHHTRLCPSFDDAVVRHRMLSAIERAAISGEKQLTL